MKKYIKHSEFVNLYNKDPKIFDRVFNKTILLNTLISKIKKESKNWEKFGYREKNRETGLIDSITNEYKMCGDLFEIYSECFFKILGCYPKIGVYNYKPEQIDDCGVDASGIGINNNPLTVQCKFRSNNEVKLIEKDLHQFPFQSQNRFGVDINDVNNMVVFTTAKGLHFYTDDKVFLKKVRTITYDDIRNIVDNNNCFWNEVQDYIKNTIKKSY